MVMIHIVMKRTDFVDVIIDVGGSLILVRQDLIKKVIAVVRTERGAE